MSTDCADDDLIDGKRDGAAPREKGESVQPHNISQNGENHGEIDGGDDATVMGGIDKMIHRLKEVLYAFLEKKKYGALGDRQSFERDLFLPPPPREDCPICAHRLPLDNCEITYAPCCGKTICDGCNFQSNMMDAKKVFEKNITNNHDVEKMLKEYNDSRHCAFCRREKHVSDDEDCNLLRSRVENNDPIACQTLAHRHRKGERGLKIDRVEAYRLLVRAVELGQPSASFVAAIWIIEDYPNSSTRMINSLVDNLLKVAAIGGCIAARHRLAASQLNDGNKEIAMGHWKIAAAAGDQKSVDSLMK